MTYTGRDAHRPGRLGVLAMSTRPAPRLRTRARRRRPHLRHHRHARLSPGGVGDRAGGPGGADRRLWHRLFGSTSRCGARRISSGSWASRSTRWRAPSSRARFTRPERRAARRHLRARHVLRDARGGAAPRAASRTSTAGSVLTFSILGALFCPWPSSRPRASPACVGARRGAGHRGRARLDRRDDRARGLRDRPAVSVIEEEIAKDPTSSIAVGSRSHGRTGALRARRAGALTRILAFVPVLILIAIDPRRRPRSRPPSRTGSACSGSWAS